MLQTLCQFCQVFFAGGAGLGIVPGFALALAFAFVFVFAGIEKFACGVFVALFLFFTQFELQLIFLVPLCQGVVGASAATFGQPFLSLVPCAGANGWP